MTKLLNKNVGLVIGLDTVLKGFRFLVEFNSEIEGRSVMFAEVTVARMDAGSKPTWTYLRRVTEVNSALRPGTITSLQNASNKDPNEEHLAQA